MRDLLTEFRPGDWEGVIGQDAVVESVAACVEEKRTRAFLFSGPSGCGKTTISRIIALKVECEHPIEIDAATHTGIDAMREVTSSTLYADFAGASKVVIVDECHALSKQAWQSLLKAVEEPPPNVWWCFCTTEPGKVPMTIRTRCAHYEVQLVNKEELVDLIDAIRDYERLDANDQDVGPADEVVYFCAEKAEGSVRAAINLLAKCWDCETRKEAAVLLRAADEETPAVIELCRAIIRDVSWSALMDLAKALALEGINAESVRIQVLAYFAKVAAGTRGDVKTTAALEVMESFADPYYSHGSQLAPIVLSLGRWKYGGD